MTPIGKAIQNFKSLEAQIDAAKRVPVVLLATGSFNPPHLMHLRMCYVAKQHLERHTSFFVVGGFLSPLHDDTVRSMNRMSRATAIPALHRIKMCQHVVAGSAWLAVDAWEGTRAAPMDYPSVLRHCQDALSRAAGRPLRGLFLCGAEDLVRCGPETIEEFGCVCVTRPGAAEKDAHRIESRYEGMVHIATDKGVLSRELDACSSTRVRRMIVSGARAPQLEPIVGPAVAAYLHAHRIGPRLRGEEAWTALDKSRGAALREAVAGGAEGVGAGDGVTDAGEHTDDDGELLTNALADDRFGGPAGDGVAGGGVAGSGTGGPVGGGVASAAGHPYPAPADPSSARGGVHTHGGAVSRARAASALSSATGGGSPGLWRDAAGTPSSPAWGGGGGWRRADPARVAARRRDAEDAEALLARLSMPSVEDVAADSVVHDPTARTPAMALMSPRASASGAADARLLLPRAAATAAGPAHTPSTAAAGAAAAGDHARLRDAGRAAASARHRAAHVRGRSDSAASASDQQSPDSARASAKAHDGRRRLRRRRQRADSGAGTPDVVAADAATGVVMSPSERPDAGTSRHPLSPEPVPRRPAIPTSPIGDAPASGPAARRPLDRAPSPIALGARGAPRGGAPQSQSAPLAREPAYASVAMARRGLFARDRAPVSPRTVTPGTPRRPARQRAPVSPVSTPGPGADAGRPGVPAPSSASAPACAPTVGAAHTARMDAASAQRIASAQAAGRRRGAATARESAPAPLPSVGQRVAKHRRRGVAAAAAQRLRGSGAGAALASAPSGDAGGGGDPTRGDHTSFAGGGTGRARGPRQPSPIVGPLARAADAQHPRVLRLSDERPRRRRQGSADTGRALQGAARRVMQRS